MPGHGRVLIFGDLQAKGNEADYYVREEEFSGRMAETWDTLCWITELVDALEPEMIVCLGDVLEVHSSISIPALDLVYNGFAHLDMRGVPIYVLSGNHDQYSANREIHSIRFLDALTNVTVVAEPRSFGDQWGFLPFMSDNEDFSRWVADLKVKVLFSHQEIAGAILREGMTTEEGALPALIEQHTQLCFNGHHHHPQALGERGSVILPGACMYHDFRDSHLGDIPKRGVAVLEANGSWRRLANPRTSRYISLSMTELHLGVWQDLDPSKTRLRVRCEESEVDELREWLERSAFLDWSIVPEATAQTVERSTISADQPMLEVAEEYLAQSDTGGLDKDRIREMLHEVCANHDQLPNPAVGS